MKMKSNLLYLALLGLFLITNSACEKDDPVIPNEEELITTVRYQLTPVNGGDAVTLSFQDLDGDGGDTPDVIGGTLAANTVYNGVMTLLNEAEDPAENITTEIEEEDEEHQLFISSSVAGISISYADEDEDGNPIGLRSTLTTGAVGAGNITVVLRHEPNKSATGVAGGDITNAGGETDIEVAYPILVE